MERVFVQTKGFEKQLKVLNTPVDFLIDIEQEVLKDLQKKVSAREVISATGGFTKLRVAFKSENKGKSGSSRVIYFDCSVAETVFLIMIYSKSSMENISADDKKVLRTMGMELKKWRPQKKKVKK